jgi:hypothetical protein
VLANVFELWCSRGVVLKSMGTFSLRFADREEFEAYERLCKDDSDALDRRRFRNCAAAITTQLMSRAALEKKLKAERVGATRLASWSYQRANECRCR